MAIGRREEARLLFVASGVALVVPADAFPGALATDVTGLIVAVGLAARELIFKRRASVQRTARRDGGGSMSAGVEP